MCTACSMLHILDSHAACHLVGLAQAADQFKMMDTVAFAAEQAHTHCTRTKSSSKMLKMAHLVTATQAAEAQTAVSQQSHVCKTQARRGRLMSDQSRKTATPMVCTGGPM